MFVSSGCREAIKGTPALHRVKGRVTLDGESLANARVLFTPKGGGRTIWGQTDEKGRYYLSYDKDSSGAPAGEYVVSIRTGRDPEEDPTTGDESPRVPESLPEIYNAKSTLKATVPEGVYDFELTTTPTAASAATVR